jgi:hypothetical protein
MGKFENSERLEPRHPVLARIALLAWFFGGNA